ncbi:hypothetical protein Lal_00042384 [Lupinus albus]|nr:hypothetical protein Lal_00042384 [Lupinus albus]
MCLGFLIKCCLVGFSLKRENPAHFKNSTLTLSLKRGILAQARISQYQQVPSRSSKNLTVSTTPICHFSPRRGNSRSGENLPEGTSEVKCARLNVLTYEYELFRIFPNESICDMKKRFSHIFNHLVALDKSFDKGELTNKVLRCLDRNWQPKLTVIMESKDLHSMPLETLFGKFQEHEMELCRLTLHEESYKRKKGISLKASTSQNQKGKP